MNLLTAFLVICHVESADGKLMVNKKDPLCQGWTQMRPIAVADVNRILKKQIYKPADRFDKEKSLAMFEILVTHYLGVDADMEDIALFWCRGVGKMHAPRTEAVQTYVDKCLTYRAALEWRRQ